MKKQPQKSVVVPSPSVVKRIGVYLNNDSQCAEITKTLGRCKKTIVQGTNFCALHQRRRYQHEGSEFFSTFSHVDKGIWIGSCDTANDPVALKSAGIKSVVNISGWEPKQKTHAMYKSLGISYHTLTSKDRLTGKVRYLGDEPIGKHLSLAEFYQYMDKGVEMIKASAHPVLVHCYAGINRSASLVSAYLIKAHNIPFQRAKHLLIEANKKRSIEVLTNSDFVKAMEHYSDHVRRV